MAHPFPARGRPRHGSGDRTLSSSARPLDRGRLRALTAEDGFVRSLVVADEADSTNDEARRLADAGAPEGTVFVAERQTAGRGRHGRVWHSPPRVGLYVSVLFRPKRPLAELPRWTLAAALAACEAARDASGVDVRIKWPNDLLCADKKVGGVLAEARTSGDGASELVVGVGINVNHGTADLPEDVRARATSLRIERGGAWLDREAILAGYLRRWGPLRTALRDGVWNDVAEAWMRLAPAATGARVHVTGPGGIAPAPGFVGRTRGIDAFGALRVEREDGIVVTLRDGESVGPAED